MASGSFLIREGEMDMRYVARQEREFVIFFDTLEKKTFKLSYESFNLLKLIANYSPAEILYKFPHNEQRKIILLFMEEMVERGVLDKELTPQVNLISNEIPPVGLSAPTKVYLNITNKCNLTCRHCVNTSGPRDMSELPLETVINLIEEMALLGVCDLVLGGGEVFLYPGIFDVISLANSKKISVAMITNGILVNKEICKKLSLLDFNYLSVSLDGATHETHDYIRGKGAFEKSLKGLYLLQKYTPHKISIRFVIMKHNLKELPMLFDMADKLEYDIGLDYLKTAGRAASSPELSLTAEDYVASLELIHNELIPKFSCKAFLPTRCYPDTDGVRFYDHFGCGAGNTCCDIDSKGYVSACNFIPLKGKDNIKEKSLQEIWLHNEDFKKLRELAPNDRCHSCNFYLNCRGGCRANLSSPFDNSPDPYCLYKTSLYIDGHARV